MSCKSRNTRTDLHQLGSLLHSRATGVYHIHTLHSVLKHMRAFATPRVRPLHVDPDSP